jgi:hypothetical protein
MAPRAKPNPKTDKRFNREKYPGEGAPIKYKPEFCKILRDMFNVEPWREVEVPHFDKDGSVKWTDVKRVSNGLPTFEAFSIKTGTDASSRVHWRKKYPEFAATYAMCKQIQKNHIIQNGLIGDYNPVFAKFVAINLTDMVDKVATDVTSAGEKITGPVVYIPDNGR